MISDSSSERFDGKTHVPDEASNSTGSGTVCRHCGEAEDSWRHSLAAVSDEMACVFEPAPAEQPRPCMWPNSGSCSCEPRNPNHTFMTGSVAASPADGTLTIRCIQCDEGLIYKRVGNELQFKHKCRAAQPSAKVEEIARELVKRLNLEDEEEQQIAAILRPYFPVDAPKPENNWPPCQSCGESHIPLAKCKEPK